MRSTSPGVSSRESSPNVSRSGKKSPATAGAISLRLGEFGHAVNGLHGSFRRRYIAPRAAAGTLGRRVLLRREFGHLPLLCGTAELFSEFVRPPFDG